MSNIFRNLILSMCIGSIVAIVINMKNPQYKYFLNKREVSQQYYNSTNNHQYIGSTSRTFNTNAIYIGVFMTAAVFVIRPIKK